MTRQDHVNAGAERGWGGDLFLRIARKTWPKKPSRRFEFRPNTDKEARDGTGVAVRARRLFEQTSIQEVAEFWDRHPCNIRHSPKPVGTKEYFDEVEARKYFVEPHIPRLAEFPRWRGKKVLEIGCGIGTDTINFALNGASVTATDLSPRSLEIVQQRSEVFGVQDRVRLLQANAEDLAPSLPDEAYDLVYSFGVIHHTPHPDRVIAQIHRYVRPGSHLKIMVYHRNSWKVLGILLAHGKGRFWRLPELIAEYSEAQTGCPITYAFTRNEVRDLLERHAFRVKEIWVDHIFPYRIPDYVAYRYRKVWYFRWMPLAVFRWLERHFGWHLCVTAEAA